MKSNVSTALKNHLATQYNTVATCWKVTLQNATVKGFTDHDTDIVFDGVTYLAASGYIASNVQSTDALNVDNLEVEGMLQSPSITEDDLRSGIWDQANVEIFLVNWADLSMGRLIQRIGTLGEVTADRNFFKAELRGLTQAFTRTIGELTSPGCRASLGDARCGVNLTPFTATGTVTGVRDDNMTILDTSRTESGPAEEHVYDVDLVQAVNANSTSLSIRGLEAEVVNGRAVGLYGFTSPLDVLNGIWIMRNVTTVANSVFTIEQGYTGLPSYGGTVGSPTALGKAAMLGHSSGYFDFGVLTWTSGLNDGLSMEVKNYIPGVITLALPMPFEIQVGDTYSMHAGCDKKLETCRDRFNNVTNFRGEPWLPGIDKVVQVARRQ